MPRRNRRPPQKFTDFSPTVYKGRWQCPECEAWVPDWLEHVCDGAPNERQEMVDELTRERFDGPSRER